METEFGRTLRRWRDRVRPEAVGLSPGVRRRAAGLRREELAALTGISADYLTRLEQGRATAPSAQVVEALARALRLPDAERDLLFHLAGHAAPGAQVVPARITPSVQRLLDRFVDTPVAVYDAAMTLVTANAPFEALMGLSAGTAATGIERNAVWRNLVGPGTRAVMTDDEQAEFEALLVAQVRLAAARYPADRALARLVRTLRTESLRFVELWETAGTDVPREPGRLKVVEHPAVGRIALACDTLVVAGDELRIMLYTAEPGSADAEKLALAIVLGTQSLVG